MSATPSISNKVSICLPMYNGEKFLAQAIESVLAQTHENFELLIADDRSSDRSYALAERYAKNDKRIVLWINERNTGIFANYNECLKRASGEYIKLFAQDDVLEKTCVEKLATVLQDHEKVGLVSCARTVIDNNGIESGVERFFEQDVSISGIQVIKDYVRSFVYRVGTPCQVMFRKEHMGTGFDPGYYLSGDIEYFLHILEEGDFFYLSEPLVKFRRHPGSVTVGALKDLSFVSDPFKIAQRYARFLAEPGEVNPVVHKPLIQGLIRKVNNAIHERKVNFDAVLQYQSAKGEADGADLDYKLIAYQFLLYASDLQMQLDQLTVNYDRLADDTRSKQTHLSKERDRYIADANHWAQAHQQVTNSYSWRITEPLRKLMKTIR
jgi:glycosyltransferase involved in cell wall biosynthesis